MAAKVGDLRTWGPRVFNDWGGKLKAKLWRTFAAITAIAAVSSLGTVLPAVASAPGQWSVMPGTGIGPVKIGQSQSQVRSELGNPSHDYKGFLYGYSFAGHSFGVNFGVGPGNNSGGPRSRVNGIESFVPGTRTGRGVGVGSTFGQVKRAYPKATCENTMNGKKTSRSCELDTKRGTHTGVATGFGSENTSRVQWVTVTLIHIGPCPQCPPSY